MTQDTCLCLDWKLWEDLSPLGTLSAVMAWAGPPVGGRALMFAYLITSFLITGLKGSRVSARRGVEAWWACRDPSLLSCEFCDGLLCVPSSAPWLTLPLPGHLPRPPSKFSDIFGWEAQSSTEALVYFGLSPSHVNPFLDSALCTMWLKSCWFPVTLGDFESLNVNKCGHMKIRLKFLFAYLCLQSTFSPLSHLHLLSPSRMTDSLSVSHWIFLRKHSLKLKYLTK